MAQSTLLLNKRNPKGLPPKGIMHIDNNVTDR